MGIFKKKKKEKVVIASPPEEQETPGEVKYEEELSEPVTKVAEETKPVVVEEQPEVSYREVPVCMSQSQINNLVIENNIMLKQIINEID